VGLPAKMFLMGKSPNNSIKKQRLTEATPQIWARLKAGTSFAVVM
jgi:hypothetical protein